MKLVEFRIKNFRGFNNNKNIININDFTCLIGKNDAGKSSIFDALDIFFNGYKKIDSDDFHIDSKGNKSKSIELIGVFNIDDDMMKIETVKTSLSEEGLLNEEGQLEIKQKITSDKQSGFKTSIIGFLPDLPDIRDIHTLKNSDLKKRFNKIKDREKITSWDSISQSINTSMRKAIISEYKNNTDITSVEIPIDKNSGKDLWSSISKSLPIFQLFKTDRVNNDSDSEIQDPLKAITKKTLQGELQDELNIIAERIKKEAVNQANMTLEKLNEMDPDLAEQITPKFAEPSWQNVFKFSLDTDQIPLNKRGSGTRRLILLNFFRAEAEKNMKESNSNNIIYAFEEPETAQHIDHQKMLMDSFLKISNNIGQQVMITTHSAELAGMSDKNSIREIIKGDQSSYIKNNPNLLHVSDELGLFLKVDGLPGRVRMVIFVEGPNDERLMRIFISTYLSKSFNIDDILIIPCGGNALNQWVKMKYLKDINPCSFYILDGDNEGSNLLNAVNHEESNRISSHQLKLGPIEYYLPYEIYKEAICKYNEDNKGNDKNEAHLVPKDKYHRIDYNMHFKPIKHKMWKIIGDNPDYKIFKNYWENDKLINEEFKTLSSEILKCYGL